MHFLFPQINEEHMLVCGNVNNISIVKTSALVRVSGLSIIN